MKSNTTYAAVLVILLIVITVSALGGYVHSATSFTDYVGNRRITKSWVWYYLLRIPTGIALAIIFFYVIRGGLLSAGTKANVMSPFGVAAISGLVGMFSKQATDKLNELFSNLFKTDKEVHRENKLN